MPFDPRNISALDDLDDNDHVMCLGDDRWHTVRELRTAASRSDPPDPYAAGLAAMRAVMRTATAATPESRFAEQWKAERLRGLEVEHEAIDARNKANASPRLTAADLAKYTPPDGYALAFAAMRGER